MDVNDELNELVHRSALDQAARDDDNIRTDFAKLGIDITTPWGLRRAQRYELVFQHAPNGAVLSQYRGILRRGKLLIDRFPNWPAIQTGDKDA